MTNNQVKFANGCYFTRGAEGKIEIKWDNGKALVAVKGAAIDYINPAYHMACTFEGNVPKYAPMKDLAKLIAASVNPKLALLVVGFRKVACSFETAVLNIAELQTVTETDPDGAITQVDWDTIMKNNPAYNAILDIAATVLGLNGISLMLKGHNYLDSDSMWARLESAVDLDANAAALGLSDYLGLLLHDALHPFSADWKVELASKVNSPLVGHVNGVLIKRMPGVPAGTTIVFVTKAAIDQLSLIRADASKAFEDVTTSLDLLISKIRAKPLDWCAMFQRSMTADNLAHVTKIEGMAAMVYGVCTVLFDRKMSIMKSASFKNNAAKHPAMVAIGANWAEEMEDLTLDAGTIAAMLKTTATYLDDEFDEEDDDDEPAAEAPGSPEKST